jgi:hypothetical protein
VGAHIEIVNGSRSGEIVPLDFEEKLILGHSRFAGLRIKDPGVGRKHAQIEPTDGGFFVVDLGSKTGPTIVNGQTLETKGSRLLNVGDEITLGEVRIRFLADAPRIARTVALGPPVAFEEDEANLDKAIALASRGGTKRMKPRGKGKAPEKGTWEPTVEMPVPDFLGDEAQTVAEMPVATFKPTLEMPVPAFDELEPDSPADAEVVSLQQELAVLKAELAEAHAKETASGTEALQKALADERDAHVKTLVQLDAARSGLEDARHAADAARDKVDALRRELDTARDELDAARKECEEARAEAHELRDQLEEINEDLISISDERDRLADT